MAKRFLENVNSDNDKQARSDAWTIAEKYATIAVANGLPCKVGVEKSGAGGYDVYVNTPE